MNSVSLKSLSRNLFRFTFRPIGLVAVILGVFLNYSQATESILNPHFLKASTIPAELTSGVDAVVRIDQQTVHFQSPGRATRSVTRVVTILNANGLDHADYRLFYGTFNNFSNINATIYDADGKQIRRLRNRDIDDRPASDGISLIQDRRVKIFSLNHNQFPFTIEVTYRETFTGLLNLPRWMPLLSERTSLQEGEFTLTLPKDRDVDFRMANIAETYPVEEASGNNRVLTWRVNNITAVRTEPLGLLFTELVPHVLLTADEFMMDRRPGSLRSWNDYGIWFGQLWEGRNTLPNEMKTYVDSVLEKHDNQRDIIFELYRYLQSNTRYVSIQLGIGGFQTETASATIRNGYGDCKALTNYLYAMLDYAGIESYPAIIYNGDERLPFDPTFVHNQFNHVVLYVITDENEEIWIESTSNTFPPGYLGESNSNRYAVLFTPEFGKLIETPKTDSENNVRKRSLEVHLEVNGSAKATLAYNYFGSFHELLRSLDRAMPGTQRRALQNWLPIRNYSVNSIEVTTDEKLPNASLTSELVLNSVATVAGGRLFVTPNLISRDVSQFASNPNRTQDIHIRFGYTESDTFTYHIPEGYRIEVIPDAVELLFDHGHYKMHVSVADDGKSFTYQREMVERRGILPANRFESYRNFRNEAVRYDGIQVVLARLH